MNIEIKKNGIKSIVKVGDRFLVDEILCDVVVNCLGFDLKAKNYPLIAHMMQNKLLKEELFLASSDDKDLHILGGLNIGRDFECTAVPDMRINVENVIKNL